MEYELHNPSDPYTFIAADKEVAALVIGLLSPAFGAGTQDGADENRVPIFIFGGYDEWYQGEFDRTPVEGLNARMKEVGQAMQSFMLGRFEDRARYNAALEAIDDPVKRDAFIAKWQDGRSSLNNIGGAAHGIGTALLEKAIEREGNYGQTDNG